MNIQELQQLCKSFQNVTEDIKWGNDLCFCIGKKMFCVIGLNQIPTSASLKVLDEEFEEFSNKEGFIPAPYVARHKWILVQDIHNLSEKEWKHYVTQSYHLVSDKLSVKIKKELNLI